LTSYWVVFDGVESLFGDATSAIGSKISEATSVVGSAVASVRASETGKLFILRSSLQHDLILFQQPPCSQMSPRSWVQRPNQPTLPSSVSSIHSRLSKICNLTCRSCQWCSRRRGDVCQRTCHHNCHRVWHDDLVCWTCLHCGCTCTVLIVIGLRVCIRLYAQVSFRTPTFPSAESDNLSLQ
jgi:hypothetical protein